MSATPRKIQDLRTPCVLIDKEIVKRNAEKMLETAKQMGADLRPHIKTAKTLEAGILMTGGSKKRISVSTIDEARFFISGGFTDILYAIPITENKIQLCKEIIHDMPDLKLMFDSRSGLQCVMDNPRSDGQPWSVFVEVDCGYGRTGLEWDSEDLFSLVHEANACQTINFKGLYCHCGDSYDAPSVEAIRKIGDQTTERLLAVSNRLKAEGIICETVGTGSTPCCNQAPASFSKLTEIHPGCYIYNDYFQTLNGSCSISDVALKVATRVIGYKKSNNSLVVDCGFLALSLDGVDSKDGYGGMCRFQDHPELRLKGMSQEIGKITTADGQKLNFDSFPIGTILYLYPYHACHTLAMHPLQYVHSGDDITEIWHPTRGW